MISHIFLWILVVVEGLLLVAVMRQVGTLLIRVGTVKPIDAGSGPAVGEDAPWVPSSDPGDRRSWLLVFMSTTCGSCDSLVPAVNAVAASYRSSIRIVVLAREKQRVLDSWAEKRKVRVRHESAVEPFDLYGVEGTPYAFVLNPQGKVLGQGGINHMEHLESLILRCGVLRSSESEPAMLDEGLIPLSSVGQGGDGHV
ncbi:MAG: TlpA family protein disulfide reductase [Actinomycetota bacterium]